MKKHFKQIGIGLISLLLVGCTPTDGLHGRIKIDGSVTVSPITQAVVEDFSKDNRGVEIAMSNAGTGGGFKRFTVGEIAIQNASRPIKAIEETAARQHGVEYYELEIAMDAIVFAVNKNNTWAKDLTAEQLLAIYNSDSTVKTWKDIDATWPDQKINLYVPATDSGTFDYFHTSIMKNEFDVRADVTASQDLNVLVTGVEGDVNGLGFFGFAYYQEAQDKVNALKINGVEPTIDSVNKKEYTPLSRPLYIYVNKQAYQTEEQTKAFVDYYLDHAAALSLEVGYIPLSEKGYNEQRMKLK